MVGSWRREIDNTGSGLGVRGEIDKPGSGLEVRDER